MLLWLIRYGVRSHVVLGGGATVFQPCHNTVGTERGSVEVGWHEDSGTVKIRARN